MPRDRHVKYDLAKAFDYILDDSKPRLSRAVRLYKLQVALLFARKAQRSKIRKEQRPGNWILTSRAAILTAEMVARLRLIENLIQESYSDTSQKFILKALLRNKEAKGLLRKVLSSNISTRHCHSLSWHELSQIITTTRENQESYAPLYHVSLNFALYGADDWHCNWSRSVNLLKWGENEPQFKTVRRYFARLPSEFVMYKHKGKGNHFAAFIWLDHFGGAYMRPEKPNSAMFVDILLKKIDNLDALRTYLGQYTYVRSQLQRQGYDVVDLQLPDHPASQEVSFQPLPSELTSLI